MSVGSQIQEKDVTDLLVELVSIKSMSGQEDELAEFVGRRLSQSNMEVSRDRHGNLYAAYGFSEVVQGEEQGPVVLFNTHLDNVPAGDGWKTDPFVPAILDGSLYGRGACDPKGALATMIIAMEAAIGAGCQNLGQKQENGRRLKGRLLFMGAVCEEISPPSEKGTWKAVKEGLVQADMAVCGEPTGNVPCIGEFGKMEYELIVYGKSAHAGAPEKGANAVLHMAELLLALDRQAERRWSDLLGRRGTLNVALVSGGVQVNIVPDMAKASFERRLVPGQTAEESMQELVAICEGVKEKIPELRYELTVTGEGNPALISEGEQVVVELQKAIREVTGINVKAGGFPAHADADWLITYGGIPTVIYGPGALSDAHTAGEKVEMNQVLEAARVLASFLEKLLYQ